VYLNCVVKSRELKSEEELRQQLSGACHAVHTHPWIFEWMCNVSHDERQHLCKWMEINLKTWKKQKLHFNWEYMQ